MDRREAMLRELNLYPMWVRREPVADEPVAAPERVELPPADDQVVHPAAPTDAADLFVAAPEPAGAADTLREFQLQNQGGALGRLSFAELQQKVGVCELCGLCGTRTQTVFGTGNVEADWMFIGEAPGADEDASGEPFTGHAGRLLDNMLQAIGIQRRDVYIANVIKCRPPEDRSPHVGEIASCLPYLRRQIELVQPKIIVALGRTAATSLLETDATIGSLRGRVHDYRGIALVATFHPAYLLRSPHEKARAWQDLLLAVEASAPC